MVALGKTIRAMADSTLSSWLSHLQRAGHHAPVPGDANTRSTWRAARSVGRRERYGLWHHETRSAAFDELTKRLPPELITIVGADLAECQMRLEEIEAAGKVAGRVRFIMTGVK